MITKLKMYIASKLVGVFLFSFVLIFSAQSAVAAPLKIKITQWVEDAYPIGVVPFEFKGQTKPNQDVAEIITNDLLRSGKFNPLAVSDMLSSPKQESDIKYRNWRVLGTESLVIGDVEQLGNDKYKVSYGLFDVFKGKKIDEASITVPARSLRTVAHKISDLIYEKLLGEPGAFSTYILYITKERKSATLNVYSLWMSDFDGERPQKLLESQYSILSPSWSPDGKRISYATLERGGAQQVVIQEWKTQRRNIVTTIKKGLYGAPAWSPDGKHLSFTIILHGNADIYRLDLASKHLKQLTNHWATDTASVWTMDGESIIFTSDRSGSAQLYKMSSNGGKVTRLTFEGRANMNPTVSSDGKLLAMVENVGGEYKIAVMELSSGRVEVLTDGRFDESPSFAPNTGMIIYATTVGNRASLATVSTDGRFKQSLGYTGDVRSPAWSPLNIR